MEIVSAILLIVVIYLAIRLKLQKRRDRRFIKTCNSELKQLRERNDELYHQVFILRNGNKLR